ncbi:MAG: bifunctional phosphoglucose/phosphomannose isomerase [Flavobacteriales bacterium]|nr:bifunctional phosphoglucose/phosphomannose isomerase [Flavobacteriales bacterium]|tara:strand:- start:1223 stop:2212 length:990 start_codon:yes stop_codon:yes gene_type:complete
MKMNDYISDFTKHLAEALEIGQTTLLSEPHADIHNVLICGLGGSGIGGTIVNDLVSENINVPISVTKDYSIPNFVDENTLVIASSYSGNTEETLYALEACQKRRAQIASVTSGGALEKFAKEKGFNCITIPGNQPPRAMFGYSFTQLFFLLNHYGLIDNSFISEFEKAIALLDSQEEAIKSEAKALATKLYGTTPVIYTAAGFEGVGVRFRQQINENSKMLCWHHVIPEMNHNELLGWRINTNNLGVVYFRNKCDFDRNKVRIDINKEVISKFTDNISEVWSKGDSRIENSLYHIHLGDWTSWYLSEMNEVDAIEIDVINFLKSSLAKI